MTTITIKNWFNFSKTHFEDIFELSKYLERLKKSYKSNNDLQIEFEDFSEEENKKLLEKWWKTINKIFNSLDIQLWK